MRDKSSKVNKNEAEEKEESSQDSSPSFLSIGNKLERKKQESMSEKSNKTKGYAMYIAADPLTHNEEKLIKQVVAAFGFVHILLDRKNCDYMKQKYFLNYDDRADIILKRMRGEEEHFKIAPIDASIQKTISESSIGSIILNCDYEKETDFRTYDRLRLVLGDANVLLMSADGYLRSSYLADVLRSDMSMQLYKKYCSEYAYAKLKIKTTKLIGLTSFYSYRTDAFSEELQARDYDVLDLDTHAQELLEDRKFIAEASIISSKASRASCIVDLILSCREDQREAMLQLIARKMNEKLMTHLLSTFGSAVIVKCSMLHQLFDSSLFCKVISLKCSKEYAIKCLLDDGYGMKQIALFLEMQQRSDDKFYDDLYVDSQKSEVELKNNIIQLINGKLKRFLEINY